MRGIAALVRPLRWLAVVPWVLGGCIVTEEIPEGVFDESTSFALRCDLRGYDVGLGCVLLCGATGSPALGVGETLRAFGGAGTTYGAETPDGADFDPRCGTSAWRTCVTNAFGGLVCSQRTRDYCAVCTEDGVAIGDAAGRTGGAPLVPASVFARSALPSMLDGTLPGESGSCLAACVAAATRPACGACAEKDDCLETEFGDVCHPRGRLPSDAPCRGDQDCASLRCAPEGRCE